MVISIPLPESAMRLPGSAGMPDLGPSGLIAVIAKTRGPLRSLRLARRGACKFSCRISRPPTACILFHAPWGEFEIQPVSVRHDYSAVGQKFAGVLEHDDAVA
jgi:hypothetical protein